MKTLKPMLLAFQHTASPVLIFWKCRCWSHRGQPGTEAGMESGCPVLAQSQHGTRVIQKPRFAGANLELGVGLIFKWIQRLSLLSWPIIALKPKFVAGLEPWVMVACSVLSFTGAGLGVWVQGKVLCSFSSSFPMQKLSLSTLCCLGLGDG